MQKYSGQSQQGILIRTTVSKWRRGMKKLIIAADIATGATAKKLTEHLIQIRAYLQSLAMEDSDNELAEKNNKHVSKWLKNEKGTVLGFKEELSPMLIILKGKFFPNVGNLGMQKNLTEDLNPIGKILM